MESDAQKVNYVYLPLLPPRIKVKMAVIWMLNFLLLPFEGFIICLHLLKMPDGSNFGFFEEESELPWGPFLESPDN